MTTLESNYFKQIQEEIVQHIKKLEEKLKHSKVYWSECKFDTHSVQNFIDTHYNEIMHHVSQIKQCLEQINDHKPEEIQNNEQNEEMTVKRPEEQKHRLRNRRGSFSSSLKYVLQWEKILDEQKEDESLYSVKRRPKSGTKSANEPSDVSNAMVKSRVLQFEGVQKPKRVSSTFETFLDFSGDKPKRIRSYPILEEVENEFNFERLRGFEINDEKQGLITSEDCEQIEEGVLQINYEDGFTNKKDLKDGQEEKLLDVDINNTIGKGDYLGNTGTNLEHDTKQTTSNSSLKEGENENNIIFGAKIQLKEKSLHGDVTNVRVPGDCLKNLEINKEIISSKIHLKEKPLHDVVMVVPDNRLENTVTNQVVPNTRTEDELHCVKQAIGNTKKEENEALKKKSKISSTEIHPKEKLLHNNGITIDSLKNTETVIPNTKNVESITGNSAQEKKENETLIKNGEISLDQINKEKHLDDDLVSIVQEDILDNNTDKNENIFCTKVEEYDVEQTISNTDLTEKENIKTLEHSETCLEESTQDSNLLISSTMSTRPRIVEIHYKKPLPTD